MKIISTYKASKDYYVNNELKNPHRVVDRNYNPFGPLNYDIECLDAITLGINHMILEAR